MEGAGRLGGTGGAGDLGGRRREPSSTVVTRGAQEAHAADAGSFAEVEASVMISVYLLFLAFFFIGLLPTYSSMDSPGLINRRRMAMRAMVSEDSGQPRSIQWAMIPK